MPRPLVKMFANNLYVKPSRSEKRSGLIPRSYRVVGACGLGMSQLHRLLGVIHGINEGKILIIKQTSVI